MVIIVITKDSNNGNNKHIDGKDGNEKPKNS